MIETVVTDLGGVMIKLGRIGFLQQFGYDVPMCKRILKATMGSDDWKEYDRGVMAEEEVLQLFVENDPEIETEIRRVIADTKGIVVRDEHAIPWIQKIKATGRKIYYLSNYSEKIMRECPEVLDFMPLMDGGIFSCDVKLIKPDREIYQMIVNKYDLVPENCVYMDDLEENLVEPRKLGFHTILVETTQQAEKELDRLLAE